MVKNGSTGAHIFVSHTRSDEHLASALEKALESLCPGKITVFHSSRGDGAGGVPTGADWLSWIRQQVREADVTIVLLTPSSLTKPWLMWEAGAVCGAASAVAVQDRDRPLWPLLIWVPPERLPTPISAMNRQARRGDDPKEFKHLLEDLLDYLEVRKKLFARDQRGAVGNLDSAVKTFIEVVKQEYDASAVLPTESAIQEWCNRLDDLKLSGRYMDVNQLHRWLDIAFGRKGDEKHKAFDERIHRRLGDLYLASQQAGQAAQQYQLAATLAPQDIFILRRLGEAELKSERTDQAERCLKKIEELDAEAFNNNIDCAALKGKYYLYKKQPGMARDAYERALAVDRSSYYLNDLLGQTLLELQEYDAAEKVYERALKLVEGSGDRTLWAHGTAAAACLCLGRQQQLEMELTAILELHPSPSNIETIKKCLNRINDRLPEVRRISSDVFDLGRQLALKP